MKRVTLLFVLLISILASALAEERILSYHADIEIAKNRSVKITEHIAVKIEGYIFKRGIYRDIPTAYDYRGGKYRIGFDILGIDKNGVAEDFHTKGMNNGKRIYVGNKNVLLEPGIYYYTIKYRVDHVLNMHGEYDELVWNINGNGWDVAIDSVSASIILPGAARTIKSAVYTGAYGKKEANATIIDKDNGQDFIGTQPLSPREGLTVAIGWEKGFLTYPNALDKLMFKLKTFSLWIVGGAGILFTLLINLLFWRRGGRDPKKGTIIPQFSAPEGYSPADCAYIDNYYKYSHRAFVSTLVNLGVKKQLSIEDEQEKKNIFTNRQKYILKRLNEGEKIEALEQDFVNDIFGSKQTQEIVRKEYNAQMATTKKALMTNLKAKHNDKNIIRNYALTLKSLIVPTISIVLGFICLERYGGSFGILILTIALLIAITYLFSRWFQRPTLAGRKLMDDIAGLKQYIKYTEEERLKIVNPPDFSFDHFEAMLPYAIALDCADEWENQFEVINPQAAQHQSPFLWYHGSNVSGFRDFDFTDINDTISSASIPPTKSSGGGSGWSGGGGFSGGGFGGGGGGGW